MGAVWESGGSGMGIGYGVGTSNLEWRKYEMEIR